MLVNRNTVCGIADGGAHVGFICDSSSPTSLLTLWARDRTRGPKLPLEFLVHKQTLATARSYGLHDRGVIAPGYRADLNVIDFANLGLEPPVVVHDLPAGGQADRAACQGLPAHLRPWNRSRARRRRHRRTARPPASRIPARPRRANPKSKAVRAG